MALVRLKRDGAVGPADTQSNEAVSDHLLTVPSLQKSLQSRHKAGLGCSSGISAVTESFADVKRLRAVGRKGHLLITSAQRCVSLVTALEGCEASSLTAFVESSLYYLLTDMSAKLPFNTEQSESSKIFRFPWSWENKECVLSYRMVLIKL